MAIKIKRKQPKKPEGDEQVAIPSPNPPADDIDQLLESDKFIETADKSLSWAARHRTTLIAVFVVVAAGVVALVIWMQQSEEKDLARSAVLTDAVKILEAPVVTDEAAGAAADTPKKKDQLTFKTEEAKFTALDKEATEALEEAKGGPGAGPARLMKARAALELGKPEEAIALYKEWLDGNPRGSYGRPLILQALATAQAEAGKIEEAAATYAELKKIDEKAYGEFASYEMARIYDQAGKPDKAKELYDAFVKSYPDSAKAEWAKMRLDNI